MKTSDISQDHDSAFLQENRQKLVQSIADQIYNTIVSKSANDDKGKVLWMNSYQILIFFRKNDIRYSRDDYSKMNCRKVTSK